MKHSLGLFAGVFALGAASLEARVYMVDDAEQLVAAIAASNLTAEADLIDMAPGLYTLNARTSDGGAGLPEIVGDLNIRGNGSEVRRYDQRDYELLKVNESGRLHLNRVTLAEGSAGAVTNHGTLVLRHVRIVDNSTATRGDAVIQNYGRLQLSDVIVGYNVIDAASGTASVLLNHGTVSMADTQFVDNRLSTRHPEASIACGLMNHGRAELRRVTISGCLAEQLDMSSEPRSVLNFESGSLYIEDLDAGAVQLQLYGSPMTVAVAVD